VPDDEARSWLESALAALARVATSCVGDPDAPGSGPFADLVEGHGALTRLLARLHALGR